MADLLERDGGLPGSALHVRAAVTADATLAEEALALLDADRAPLARAHALLTAARLRRTGDDLAGARSGFAEARELAERCGATPVAAAAIEGTVAVGGRPRRARAVGTTALTPAERRTAEQASLGLTNREIAQALFVTEKTIEGHLSSAYRKLGITSRSQLGAALDAA
jgi:DNA-binding CsgD family transcriptional regulator